VVPLTTQVLEILRQHQQQMDQLGIHDPYGLVFVTPTSHTNIYDHLVGRVWHRSLQRCGLKPRRLYAQRHSFLSHALAIGNSPADLAAAAGHSTKMLLDTYAKPTGRLKMPTWQTA
jgi:integrase